ncbi:MAG: 2-phospho-L-lactate transferase [Actinophytocola sp.]|nr:2-phospho-L-lactate transferase [Actinophytocola sp.]
MGGIVGLGGGIGGSRLWRALAAVVDPAELTLVVNTADDMWMHGLRICPDLDTTLYALSGRQDPLRGWGVRDESFQAMQALRDLGEPVWFHLGDRDLATHLARTGMLAGGAGLTEITRRLATAMGVRARVLPMTEQEVATRIETTDGAELHYEEFLVRHAAQPTVRRVCYQGIENAVPTPDVVRSIAEADLVVLGPSNPLASITPILSLPGVADAVRATSAPVVAVTPIVTGVPIVDAGEHRRAISRAALLRSIGKPATASAVAELYQDLCQTYVIDLADADEADIVRGCGIKPVVVSTLLARDPGTSLVDMLLAVRRARPTGGLRTMEAR